MKELSRSHRPVFLTDSGFHRVVTDRVTAYFQDVAGPRTGGITGKALFMLAWFAASFVIVLLTENAGLRLTAAVSLGIAMAGVGFNIFHDANHQTFARTKSLNTIIAIACSALLGFSRFHWHQNHHVFHHRFTNLHAFDNDLNARGFLRLAPDEPFRAWHRFQWLYWPAIYAATTLEWVFVKDFKQYFTGRLNSGVAIAHLTPSQHVEFWLSKLAYLALFLGLPIWLIGPMSAVAVFVTTHLVFGLILTSITQLGHVNGNTEFPHVSNDDPKLEDSWAIHQLRTSADFAPNNRIATWYLGGVNLHVEHHLFPGVCHRHYPTLSRIVEATAREHGLPYNVYPTWRAAIAAHAHILAQLSKPAPFRADKPIDGETRSVGGAA